MEKEGDVLLQLRCRDKTGRPSENKYLTVLVGTCLQVEKFLQKKQDVSAKSIVLDFLFTNYCSG